jgi:hypothetical protein
MRFLDRLLGQAVQSSVGGSDSFTETTARVLREAGWTPERRVDLSALPQRLGARNLVLHGAAREFLERFYGLEGSVPIDGFPGINGFVCFKPEAVIRFLDPQQDGAFLAKLISRPAYPVGTTSGHTVFIFMDDRGRSYLLDMEWTLFGELAATPAEAVEALCDGRNGRVDSMILDEGRPTRQVIRAGNEREFWELDTVPDLRDCLPPVSLSPLRRPPTGRAMVQAAQKLVGSNAIPRSGWPQVLVTCGGFACAPSGQTYFVAHCENSLYVRRKAGFKVSAPPPGIPPDPRVGECLPFTPP